MKIKIVSVYSLIHFIVDFACAVLVSNLVAQKIELGIELITALLLYNFFAFAMQLPIGIIADKVNKNAICSAIGCLLVALGFCFVNYGLIACIISGIGNAMFHVGGGIDTLNISNKKASLSGIFVSTGAMGIFLGSKLKQISYNHSIYFVLVLIIAAISLLLLYKSIKGKVNNNEIKNLKLKIDAIIAIVCLFITVCIRGYVGLILAFEWKSNLLLAVISILAVIFGKMLGGIIGDKIGFNKISIISLTVSAICFIFAFDNPILGIIATLLFNMTMPITLTALSNILDDNKGMAFGLLTLALFIGAVPVIFGFTNFAFSPIGLFLVSIISALILSIGIKKYNKVVKNDT